MRTKLLILFAWCLYFSVFAENGSNDSIFFKSFNLRYQNPNEGITIAKSLIKDDPQKAYLSLAYNYFFKSDYDSAEICLKKINITNKEDPIVNLALSCQGFILQREGKDDEAFVKFDSVKQLYDTKLESKLKKSEMLTHCAVINEIGIATLAYYYLSTEDSPSKLIKCYDILINNWKSHSKDLEFHVNYFLCKNYLKENSSNDSAFYKSLKVCLVCTDKSDNYRAGNLFEILGLYNTNSQNHKILLKHLQGTDFDAFLKNTIVHFLTENNYNIELEFRKKSLYYFMKFNDPFQIAGANFHIAEFYYNQIINNEKEGTPIIKNQKDSLYFYCNKALELYYSRATSFYSNFQNDNNYIDQWSDSIVSFSFCLKALRIKKFYYGLFKSEQDSFIHITSLTDILEKRYIKVSDSFYNSMNDAKLKKVDAEKRTELLTYLAIVILVFLILIFILITLYFKRKTEIKLALKEKETADELLQKEKDKFDEIERAKRRVDDWNNVLNEVFNIKEKLLYDINISTLRNFRILNKLLQIHFDAEYCAIGIKDNNDLKDIAYNFDQDLNNEKEAKFKSLIHMPIENTIIGNFLETKKDYIKYEESEIDKIKNDHLKTYETFLTSKKIKNIDLFGLFWSKDSKDIEDKEIIGYISFINIRNYDIDFTSKIFKLVTQIMFILSSEKDRINNLSQRNDESFINGLVKPELSISDVINNSLTHFLREFNAGIVSFRVPVINGLDENPTVNLQLVLKDLIIDDSLPNKSQIIDFYKSEKKSLSLSQVTYNNLLLNNLPDNVYVDEIGQNEEFYKRFLLSDFIKTRTNIIVPVMKSLTFNSNDDVDIDKNNNWRNVYGVFNIQLKNASNIEQIKRRLKFLSMSISHALNSIINKNKYNQIRFLHNEIRNLDYKELSSFYNQIAFMIKKVINAEICSVFIFNKSNNRLELKATTATRAIYNNKEIKISEFAFIDDIYYDINENDSITLSCLKENKTYMIYSLSTYKKSSIKFIELSQKGDIWESEKYSRIIAPLKSFENPNDCFGVIRCLGARNRDRNLIHSFWDFDRETVEFISALAARFIINAQLSDEKDNFVKQVVHETLSPITEMMHRQVEYYNRLERIKRLPIGFESHHRNFLNNIMLQKQILSDLSDVSMNKSDLMNINAAKENTKKIITDIVKLFKDNASDEKNITIVPSISGIPDLFIDRSKMQQVFINLLKNAINYSFNDTKIYIYYNLIEKYEEMFSNFKWHEIKFVNSGIGIPENETKDIFILYRRGSNAARLKPSGSGIGLFLVDKIIKAHGGFCKVMKPNNPTEISIFLPAK